MSKCKYIALEGYECSGKSTLITYLQEIYKGDERVVFVREPGYTPLAETLRGLMLKNDGNISAKTEFLLMQAARQDLMEKFVIPALNDDKVVVSDRCFISSMLLQTSRYLRKLETDSNIIGDKFMSMIWKGVSNTDAITRGVIYHLNTPTEVIAERLIEREGNNSYDSIKDHKLYLQLLERLKLAMSDYLPADIFRLVELNSVSNDDMENNLITLQTTIDKLLGDD